jgi:hypothetical protein
MNRYHIFKNSDNHFISYDFSKNYLHYINRNFILCLQLYDLGGKPQINGKDTWQTADHRENPVCTYLPAFPVGGADRRRKIGGVILSTWPPLDILVSPRSRPHTTKIGRGHWACRISMKKLSPAPCIKLICGPGPQVERFLNR